ncbi:MAG TPA: uroporphyrinogen decarboxylase family protein [Planctomycetota bacterium]|nr:uroporphyrinogen decarboxylase family protein [Planctomycetota bacterium]
MTHVERMKAMFEGGRFDRLVRQPFGFFPQTHERWQKEGMPEAVTHGGKGFREYFGFDPSVWLGQGVDLGWCEAPLVPRYEEKILRTVGGHEIVQDFIGRHKAYPVGQREQVMPTYLKHTVASRADWEEEVRPRLDADTPERWEGFDEKMAEQTEAVARGEGLRNAGVIGGYMYLRSLIGPVDLLYRFYDEPELLHDMMRHWRDLMLTCLRRSQDAGGPFYRFMLAEDICYKSGPLISPDMMREFLSPYYRDVYDELQSHQSEKLHFEIDTDGDCRPVIDVYQECGVDAMSPFEVASGCDVVKIGRQYPALHMRGGIDKRVLARGPDAIDEMLAYIMPAMTKRGRYIPSSDHAVPDDVSLDNYRHYRKRVMEMDAFRKARDACCP